MCVQQVVPRCEDSTLKNEKSVLRDATHSFRSRRCRSVLAQQGQHLECRRCFNCAFCCSLCMLSPVLFQHIRKYTWIYVCIRWCYGLWFKCEQNCRPLQNMHKGCPGGCTIRGHDSLTPPLYLLQEKAFHLRGLWVTPISLGVKLPTWCNEWVNAFH